MTLSTCRYMYITCR